MSLLASGRNVVRTFLVLVFASLIGAGTSSAAPLLTEGFDDISTLSGSGWSLINNSSPIGVTDWFQGNTGIFNAQSGPADSYIAANFNGADFGGAISEWLLLPILTLGNGDILSFSAQASDAFWEDQLEVRLSTNGASSNVGSTATSVGDFSTLLLTLNPISDAGWGQYSVTLSGLAAPTSARLAFRYVVDDTSVRGEYIGIDSVAVTKAVPEPSSLSLLGVGMLASLTVRRKRR